MTRPGAYQRTAPRKLCKSEQHPGNADTLKCELWEDHVLPEHTHIAPDGTVTKWL